MQAEADLPRWQAARTQAADLRARLGDGELSEEAAQDLAKLWNISLRTVCRRVHAFRRDGSVRAFLSRRRGPSAEKGAAGGPQLRELGGPDQRTFCVRCSRRCGIAYA